jgi:hypothetical protein
MVSAGGETNNDMVHVYSGESSVGFFTRASGKWHVAAGEIAPPGIAGPTLVEDTWYTISVQSTATHTGFYVGSTLVHEVTPPLPITSVRIGGELGINEIYSVDWIRGGVAPTLLAKPAVSTSAIPSRSNKNLLYRIILSTRDETE